MSGESPKKTASKSKKAANPAEHPIGNWTKEFIMA